MEFQKKILTIRHITGNIMTSIETINDPYNLIVKYRFIFIKLVLLQIKHIHLLFL
jgi:hypothetical protein